EADEVLPGLRPDLEVAHLGRELEPERAEAGDLEASAPARGRDEAEVELSLVREAPLETRHVPRDVRLLRGRTAEVGMPARRERERSPAVLDEELHLEAAREQADRVLDKEVVGEERARLVVLLEREPRGARARFADRPALVAPEAVLLD